MNNIIKKIEKRYLIIFLLIILLVSVISFSISYLNSKNTKSNVFKLGNVDVEVIETVDLENKIKKDVSFKNTGNVDSFIRVKLLYYFIDDNEVILTEDPVINDDYTIDLLLEDWILGSDGFYYYKKKVSPLNKTSILINECTNLKTYDNKNFVVDVTAQAIQANPNSAVIEAWSATIVNDEIYEVK